VVCSPPRNSDLVSDKDAYGAELCPANQIYSMSERRIDDSLILTSI
jgi:hypothetical protein